MNCQQLIEPPNVIMPLSYTQKELESTANVLAHLWCQRQTIQLVAHHLAKRTIRQIILIGSGDSLAVAKLACFDMETMLHIPCRVWQSYEFIQQATQRLSNDCLVIAISASGRPSPVLEALRLAIASNAVVIGLTNQANNPFSQLPEYSLLTHAHKLGVPTQSTTATLFLLLLLGCEWANNRKTIASEDYQLILHSLHNVVRQLPDVQKTITQHWQQQDRSVFFTQPVTFLSTGSTNAIATLATNLMSCGPQLHTDAFLLEEYHHSLRLNQTNKTQRFIVFTPLIDPLNLIAETKQTLRQIGANMTILSPYDYLSSLKNHSDSLSCVEIAAINRQTNFYHLIFLQTLSLQLAADYLADGGTRVTLDG